MWKFLLSEIVRAWVAVGAAVIVNVTALRSLDLGRDIAVIAPVNAFVTISVFLVAYVVLSLVAFLAAPHQELRQWVTRQGRGTFLGRYVWLTQPGGGLALYFAVAALVTALLVLPDASVIAGGRWAAWVAGATVVMVFAGWLAVATTYAIDYLVAHHHAGPDALVFPGTEDPRFSDYLYFSIGVTASYAPPDVSVRSTALRRRMTFQMLIAFVFATVTLAAVVTLTLSQLN